MDQPSPISGPLLAAPTAIDWCRSRMTPPMLSIRWASTRRRPCCGILVHFLVTTGQRWITIGPGSGGQVDEIRWRVTAVGTLCGRYGFAVWRKWSDSSLDSFRVKFDSNGLDAQSTTNTLNARPAHWRIMEHATAAFTSRNQEC